MKKRTALSRRFIVRGIGGVGLALPALEMMMPSRPARAGGDTGIPSRFLVAYAGLSYGKPDGDVVVPNAPGSDYAMTRGLAPIGDGAPVNGHVTHEAFNVREHVNVVTDLLIPFNMDPSGMTPPGGLGASLHERYPGLIQLTGYRRHDQNDPLPGPTADQIVADEVFPSMPVLAYRVEPVSYRGFQGSTNPFLSWRMAPGGGEAEPYAPQFSPQGAYQAMLAEWVPPDPAQAAEALAMLEQRLSALDLVQEGRQALLARVGSADRQRLELHFEKIFELETRLDSLGGAQSEACTGLFEGLKDPGPDSGEVAFHYSDEEGRARALTDLVHLAMVCDSRRSVSLMYSHLNQCNMGFSQLPGWPGLQSNADYIHALTHAANPPESTADAIAWYVKHFARLVDLLRNSPEPDGTSILDHTAMLFLLEGGKGWSPSENKISVHSTEAMMMLTAGGSALGLKTGEHIVANKAHPSQVVISAMQAVGSQADELGEVSGAFPGLFA